jgi:TalC/MipB family fructose-6-phosphate aldolase
MEFWLDTIDRKAIDEARELGLLAGITTNPSLLSMSKEPLEDVLDDLLNRQSGPIAVQIIGNKTSDMIEQAKDLYEYSTRIIVKIPAIKEGIRAIHHLAHIGIRTMATAILEPMQGLLAARAGASYLAPYISRMGEKSIDTVSSLHQWIQKYNLNSKIIVASLRSVEQILQCCSIGVMAATLSEHLFQECVAAPEATYHYLQKFEEDWNKGPESKLLLRKKDIF